MYTQYIVIVTFLCDTPTCDVTNAKVLDFKHQTTTWPYKMVAGSRMGTRLDFYFLYIQLIGLLNNRDFFYVYNYAKPIFKMVHL